MEAKQSKTKVDAIYPLNFLQQALLLHSLQGDYDQGFLQVQSLLKGRLDKDKFKDAWQKTLDRHESLRTSIHWENLEKNVQVVHKEVEVPFEFFDWSNDVESEYLEKLSELKKKERKKSLDLTKAPVIKVFLIKLSEDEHTLLWSCHHILSDGWSASIILQDLLTFYDENISGQNIQSLSAVPSYKSYLNWINKQDKSTAKEFWAKSLENYTNPTIIGKKLNIESNFETFRIKLTKKETEYIKNFSLKNQITQNTLIQGIWAVLLSKFVNKNDITFGTIVSGRSVDLPNAELMAGMFMNVLPMRVQFDSNENFIDWLKELQIQQSKIRNFEYVQLDEIQSFSDISVGKTLFDSLVVFENMPVENLSGGGITLDSFESGLTSNYPLTFAIKPTENIEFFLKYNSASISKETINWFAENLQKLVKNINSYEKFSIDGVINKLSEPIKTQVKKEIESIQDLEKKYVAPTNKVELELVKIWEDLFDKELIGIEDNFFEIGGTSMIAVRMFAKIEKSFNRNLSPTNLLQNQTIREIATQIQDSDADENWTSIVPLRANGTKTPVFCIHGGGGHVLYYRTLAESLDEEQPVYGIQPIGLGGIESPHESVEEMATHYLSEIKKIVPNGPYHLVSYCFSNAVSIEMVHQLKKIDENNVNLIIIDSDPMFMEIDKANLPTFYERAKGYSKLLFNKNKVEISSRAFRKLKRFNAKINPFAAQTIKISKEEMEHPENNQRKYFLKTLEQMKDAYRIYDWKPVDQVVKLILAGSFETHPWSKVVLKQWRLIAKGGVDYVFIPGTHADLFEKPAVFKLAKHLQNILDQGKSDGMVRFSE